VRLVRETSSSATVSEKWWCPTESSTRSMMRRCEAETRAVGTSWAASSASSRAAPGISGTPRPILVMRHLPRGTRRPVTVSGGKATGLHWTDKCTTRPAGTRRSFSTAR
jgi:hypothetical protein